MDKLPVAFDVEGCRRELLRGVAVPPEMVNESLNELRAQIKAETVKYFSFRGKVIDRKNVADNGARLQAIDQVLSLAGLYRPDDRRMNGPSVPQFAIEITKDGVIRIATGSSSMGQLPEREPGSATSQMIPVAILPPAPGRAENIPVNDAIKRFNTILDEIVDE